jgi:hypothetical protein
MKHISSAIVLVNRGGIPSRCTATGRLPEGRGVGAIDLRTMPCRAEWPVALSRSNGAELFKFRKVAGDDG